MGPYWSRGTAALGPQNTLDNPTSIALKLMTMPSTRTLTDFRARACGRRVALEPATPFRRTGRCPSPFEADWELEAGQNGRRDRSAARRHQASCRSMTSRTRTPRWAKPSRTASCGMFPSPRCVRSLARSSLRSRHPHQRNERSPRGFLISARPLHRSEQLRLTWVPLMPR